MLSVVMTGIAFVAGVSYCLAPQRLSKMVSGELSRYLNADVRVANLRFSLISSFPRLSLEADSINVRSRSLQDLPDSIADTLSPDAPMLASCGKFHGGIDLLALLRGEICLLNVSADGFSLNLVAVNDSVANYNIFPSSDSPESGIRRITANAIRMTTPRAIAYTSLSSGLNGIVHLHDLSLTRTGGRKSDSYMLDLHGRVHAAIDTLAILPDFPFSLDGNVDLRFNPFGIALDNYNIALGNVRTRTSMNFEAGVSPHIDNFSFHIATFRLMNLLRYLPKGILPDIKGLKADITVNASARLTRPYRLSSSSLPSLQITFSVPDGDVAYTSSGGSIYRLRHIGFKGIFTLDGADTRLSTLDIPRFSLEGEGSSLDISAHATDIFGSPEITATLDIRSGIKQMASHFPAFRQFRPSGDVTLTTLCTFRLPSVSSPDIEDFDAKGVIRMKRMAITMPGDSLTARINGATIDFKASSAHLDPQERCFPVAVKGTLQNVRIQTADSLRGKLTISKVAFATTLHDVNNATSPQKGDVAISAASSEFTRSGVTVSLRDLDASVHTDSSRVRIIRPAIPDYADSALLALMPHTPETLSIRIPSAITGLLDRHHLNGTLRLSGGSVSVPDYPDPLTVGSCAIDWNTDSVAIRRFTFSSGNSSLSLRGSVSNLRQYLAYPDRAILHANLESKIDTLDINRLARACKIMTARIASRRSAADSISFSRHTEARLSREDTTAFLLPRNIKATVRLTGNEVIYTNLHLTRPAARITLDNGCLNVDTLSLGASFASAGVSFRFDTSDIENISCSGSLAIDSLHLKGMYNKFPSIRRKMPELVNLSGTLSASADFRLGIYPTMAVDLPGFTASVALTGSNLKLHQTDFIHHVARMMLIFSHDDIRIRNIRVDGNIHDNLIELYPFALDFDRYRLTIQGINDFAGRLYYHIGVDHSPIPFRFGIEAEGEYRHPRLRFCGSGWNPDKARGITGHIIESGSFNFVSETRRMMNKFIDEAAKSAH